MCETKEFLCELNAEDFSEHLVEKGVHEDASVIKSNRISGKIFLQLLEDDLKELILTIGDRVLIKGLMKEIESCQCQVWLLLNEQFSANVDIKATHVFTNSMFFF